MPRGFHYRRSLASRVTVLTTLAVGLTVAVLSAAAYATVRSQTMHTLDDALLERAQSAARTGTLDALSSQDVPSWALGAADVKIIFLNGVNQTARTADHSETLPLGQPELDVARGKRQSSARTVHEAGDAYRVVSVPAGKGQALILAQSLGATDRTLDRLGLVMLLFGLAGIIAAGLAGWAVAANGLRPVRRLTAALEEITRTQDLQPIAVEGTDEIARLATSFNDMLTALSASQQRQRQLVADAGHELRTPLTSLRTNLDLLVQAGASLPEDQRRELLDDVRGQIGEMTTLIGDLVELAREHPQRTTIEPVDLAAIVGQAVTRVKRRAPGLTFDVRVQPWWLVGDAAGLERGITNLLDNAAKWSPPDGVVRVHLEDGTLMVADAGPGIEGKDLPHVFERFYRATSSRGMPGSGLGLSIVRAVAERHGGVVRAGTGPDGGAGFWFTVPGSPTPAQEPPGSATTT
jgi:two-component system, OmpR family, sensor histidine kinase MprB